MSILKVASKKAKNGYTFKVDFRYKTNGITTRYVKSGFLTKKEAKEHEEDIKAQIRLYGRVKKIYNGTLNMCFDEWLKVDSNQLAPNTINLYKQTYNKHVKNTIGKEKLVLLKYKEIQAFINKSDISYDNCIAIKKVLNMVFNFAVKNEYVENNPIQFIKNTKVKDKKDKNNYITFEEYQTLTNKLNQGSFNDHAISIAISIGYYTGLRVSEILALNKNDFDFINNTISVTKQIANRNTKAKETTTKNILKTISSNSLLPLVNELKEILLVWFDINPYEVVVCNKKGLYFNPVNIQAKAKAIAKTLNIEGFHFHMLRHTLITNLHTNGVDVKTTQELARHSNINTTLNVYTHLEQKNNFKALSSVFDKNYPKNTPKIQEREMLS